ncbi:bifunctional DNA primase/polymerase [Kitasatospora sp. NBC_01287]|uniref:bifunctional DNA primase/polymerase n=1 Tax=Kitasatospora sp. NBC_01287 TaxID=2903573 RepID=UPI002253C55C|nr:bifunctional DNA primase/polymerase [Kitasatospora sp. NBC_01287]MCX4747909.1 bifunctional DNA primase/polymerase [Kitasatospora sp. NBC_01287]
MRESRESSRHRKARQALLQAALTCAQHWNWPVVPGAVLVERVGGPGESAAGPQVVCSCDDPRCPVPAAHPHDQSLLAATTDPRMVRWWWERHSPQAPVIVATGRAVAAVSVPAAVGGALLGYLDALRLTPGPVLAGPTRWALLVAPYSYQELAESLVDQERTLGPGGGPGVVPSSVRYHGPGGFLVLPPSRVGDGGAPGRRPGEGAGVRWVRRPVPGPAGGVWLPPVASLLEALVAAGSAAPDGSRLAH